MRRIVFLLTLAIATALLVPGAIAATQDECDATVPDGGSIRDATNAAEAGDVVCVQASEYTFGSDWTIDTGITLRGLGDDPSAVEIDRSGHAGRSLVAAADDLTLENFTLVGNGDSGDGDYGIKAENAQDLTLTNLVVTDTGASAIDLNGIDGADVSNVTVTGAGGNGFAATNSTQINATQLDISGSGWSGVAVYAGPDYFDREDEDKPAGVQDLTVENSTLTDNNFWGVQVEDSSEEGYEAEFTDISVVGVQFTDNGKATDRPVGQVGDLTEDAVDLDEILADNAFDRAAVVRDNPIVGGMIFSSIHDAVDLAEASAATTVEVEPGTYPEHVQIDDTVELVGDTADRPVIQGSLDVRGNVSPNDPITDVVISDLNIEASDGEVALIALSNLQGPYETQDLEVRNVDITTNGQSAIGLFDVNGVDLDNLDVDASGDDGGLGLVGVADLSLTDSSIDLEDGTGLALSHVEDYQPSGELTVSDVDFTSQAEATAVVDLALGPAAMDDVDVLLDGVDIQRPQARTVPSVQIAGRDNRGEERGVPQVTVRDSTINHSADPPEPEQATSTVRVAGHVNLAVEESQLIGGPIGGYAEAELFAFDNDISFTGHEGIWNGPGDEADVRLYGNQIAAADQNNAGRPDVTLLDLPPQLNEESGWDEEAAALEICDTNGVDSVLIGSDYAEAIDCPEPPDLTVDLSGATDVNPGFEQYTIALTNDRAPAEDVEVQLSLEDPSGAPGPVTWSFDGAFGDLTDASADLAQLDVGEDGEENLEVTLDFANEGSYELVASADGDDASGNASLDVEMTEAPADDEPTEDEPAEDEPAEDEPAEDEPAEDEPAEDEPADDDQPQDEPVQAEEITDVLDEPTERVAGETRVETAVDTSQAQFPEDGSAEAVVIARNDEYADALAGGPLAFAADAPILLTSTGELHEATAAEVDRLGAQQAYILGGGAAVSPAVEQALTDDTAVDTVTRLAGADRFATASAVADELAAVRGVDSFDGAYVTRGVHPEPDRGWADAVSVSGLAAAQGRPILLSTLDELPAPTETALGELGVDEATIVGGPAAVDAGVADAIGEQTASVNRLAGDTRYQTSVAVAEESVAAGFGPDRTWLATGRDYPDAITGGPAVARDEAALVLIDGDTPSASQASLDWLADTADQRGQLRLLGGTDAMTDAVLDAVE